MRSNSFDQRVIFAVHEQGGTVDLGDRRTAPLSSDLSALRLLVVNPGVGIDFQSCSHCGRVELAARETVRRFCYANSVEELLGASTPANYAGRVR
ncbi:hypothetical protein FEZ60_19245 [Rhodococcus sp. MS16]|uniref:hypothetical protein n=1 Tax=Rhodococcus sp. MS16 TaxID=2579941 RepID=UPI0015620207|nr:hypothetical protein [Rhodococcus sp. MS16]NRI67662.1 hypothetical protein [Rhodococcus sp. MS16]